MYQLLLVMIQFHFRIILLILQRWPYVSFLFCKVNSNFQTYTMSDCLYLGFLKLTIIYSQNITKCLQCSICYAINRIHINKDLINQTLGHYICLLRHYTFHPFGSQSLSRRDGSYRFKWFNKEKRRKK